MIIFIAIIEPQSPKTVVLQEFLTAPGLKYLDTPAGELLKVTSNPMNSLLHPVCLRQSRGNERDLRWP